MKLFDNPWNTIFFAGFVVFYWIRHVFIERTKQEKKTLRRMDMLEKILLIGMVPGLATALTVSVHAVTGVCRHVFSSNSTRGKDDVRKVWRPVRILHAPDREAVSTLEIVD
jgi:hypothetical protein